MSLLLNCAYSKETGVKGRSLNLTQGVVESTENIYRYHMQIQSGTAPTGTKSPPTPIVQTPVGAGSHSRSSSHASSQGTAPTPNNITAAAVPTATTNSTSPAPTNKETEKVLQ